MLLKPGTTDEDSSFFQDKLRMADLLICDECQELKNSSTTISSVVASIPTPSRLGLTGSPLSNNLGEYYEMISFAAPNYLNSRGIPFLSNKTDDFKNRFENPIINGAYSDSNAGDIRLSKKMMRVLKKWIDPIVMRLDDAPLIADLDPKIEYAIGLRMPKFQYEVCS